MAVLCCRKAIASFIIALACTSIVNAKVYLVSVGIADYAGTKSDLCSPVNDANSMINLYKNDVDTSYRLLTDTDATIENISKAMEIFSLAETDDVVLFYYSGHGYHGGLSVYDGRIDYATIRHLIARSKCKNKLMFIDTCFSGGITNISHSFKADRRCPEDANVILFLSSRSDEYSRSHKTLKNAYFTHFLQKGLQGYADIDENRIVTARELFVYVHNNVKRISKNRQHPVMWGQFPDDAPIIKRIY